VLVSTLHKSYFFGVKRKPKKKKCGVWTYIRSSGSHMYAQLLAAAVCWLCTCPTSFGSLRSIVLLPWTSRVEAAPLGVRQANQCVECHRRALPQAVVEALN
jgi:hypothetical protein